mmetsp:Transcript_92581/g.262077  ORF Transcript_92581/g.262077 Transcript_92581/m.262077 type:complete len:394 (-) Transcript_92581:603-1784(-)
MQGHSELAAEGAGIAASAQIPGACAACGSTGGRWTLQWDRNSSQLSRTWPLPPPCWIGCRDDKPGSGADLSLVGLHCMASCSSCRRSSGHAAGPWLCLPCAWPRSCGGGVRPPKPDWSPAKDAKSTRGSNSALGRLASAPRCDPDSSGKTGSIGLSSGECEVMWFDTMYGDPAGAPFPKSKQRPGLPAACWPEESRECADGAYGTGDAHLLAGLDAIEAIPIEAMRRGVGTVLTVFSSRKGRWTAKDLRPSGTSESPACSPPTAMLAWMAPMKLAMSTVLGLSWGRREPVRLPVLPQSGAMAWLSRAGSALSGVPSHGGCSSRGKSAKQAPSPTGGWLGSLEFGLACSAAWNPLLPLPPSTPSPVLSAAKAPPSRESRPAASPSGLFPFLNCP